MSTKIKTNHKDRPSDLKTIAEHLGELRWRLAILAVVFVVFSSLAYTIRVWLVHIVLSPIGQQKLVYLTPAGGFSFIFSITIYAGIVATAPLAIYHLYRFITPALPSKARKYTIRVVVASVVLMVAGVIFGYLFAIPAALKFLTAFAGGFVEANLTADSYLSFFVAYVLGLGLLFQLPLLLVFWNWVSPLPPGGLLNSQRFVLVGAFVAAALITPTPDAFNQILIALPIVAVYQLGVIAVYVMNRSSSRQVANNSLISKKFTQEEVRQKIDTVSIKVPRQAMHKRTVRCMDGFVVSRPASRPVMARPSTPRVPNRPGSMDIIVPQVSRF